MILVDASVWIEHLRHRDAVLAHLIEEDAILMHPYTIAEIGLGSLADRDQLIEQLESLPVAPVASHNEVMALIGLNRLYGTGVGYVDCHLLTTALLIGGRVWTRDKRLMREAERLRIAYTE